jgi:hypothetical protein
MSEFHDRLYRMIAGEVPEPQPGSILDFLKRGETKPLAADDFKAMSKLIQEANETAPRCHGFLAHHSVPYGKLYRQWDTKGRLWCWVNKGWIADLERGAQKRSWVPGDPIYDIYTIPVIDAHAVNRRLQFGENDE